MFATVNSGLIESNLISIYLASKKICNVFHSLSLFFTLFTLSHFPSSTNTSFPFSISLIRKSIFPRTIVVIAQRLTHCEPQLDEDASIEDARYHHFFNEVELHLRLR
jgi:hypothetical protein